jgi:hypothetical protein
MNYLGTIIEESLSDKTVLSKLDILSTKVEPIVPAHATPWLTQWTLHKVSISEGEAEDIANVLSKSLEPNHWYADYKNETTHYIIFLNKVFKIDRLSPLAYKEVKQYGLTLGIPEHQLPFK